MLTTLYIHNPFLAPGMAVASEVQATELTGRVMVVQGNFADEPPLWYAQQKEWGDDVVRRTAYLMAYQDKMRNAPPMEVTRVFQEQSPGSENERKEP